MSKLNKDLSQKFNKLNSDMEMTNLKYYESKHKADNYDDLENQY